MYTVLTNYCISFVSPWALLQQQVRHGSSHRAPHPQPATSGPERAISEQQLLHRHSCCSLACLASPRLCFHAVMCLRGRLALALALVCLGAQARAVTAFPQQLGFDLLSNGCLQGCRLSLACAVLWWAIAAGSPCIPRVRARQGQVPVDSQRDGQRCAGARRLAQTLGHATAQFSGMGQLANAPSEDSSESAAYMRDVLHSCAAELAVERYTHVQCICAVQKMASRSWVHTSGCEQP